MALNLFYNALTRGGAVADVTADEVKTTKVLPDGSLSHWTHFVKFPSFLPLEAQKLFVYNRHTRGGAIGVLTPGGFEPQKPFAAGAFSPWTHICAVGSLLFFYDLATGAGAFAETQPKTIHLTQVNNPVSALELANVKLDSQLTPLVPINKVARFGPESEMDCVTVRSFAAGSFSPWTHVVSCGRRLFFYNRTSGAGSLQKISRKKPVTAKDLVTGGEVEMNTVKDFPGGSLGSWTHVIGLDPYVFFYNQTTRAGKFMRAGDDGLTLVKEFAPNSFSPWTHILPGETLTHAEPTGVPGIGELHNEFVNFKPNQVFLRPDGASILFYDKKTGMAAMSRFSNNTYTNGKVYNKPGAFGNWTSISAPADTASPFDHGYQLFRKSDGSGVGIRTVDGKESSVSVPASNDLPAEKKDAAVEKIIDSMKKFIEEHAEEIESGKIKAVDIGGVLYGTAAAAVLIAVNPLAGAALLVKIMGYSAFSLAGQVGRYYGAAVDDLVAVLKGENKENLIKIIAIMGTMSLVSSHLAAGMLLGTTAWDLTKKVGAKLGGAVEDALNGIAGAAGDVFDTGKDIAQEAANFVEGVFDSIGL